MAKVRISARLPVDLYQRLEDDMTTNKLSLTEAIIAEIATYFGSDNLLWLRGLVSWKSGIRFWNGEEEIA